VTFLIFGLLAAGLGYLAYDVVAKHYVLDLLTDPVYQKEAVNYNNPAPIVGIKKEQALMEQMRNPTMALAAVLGGLFGLAEGIRRRSIPRAVIGLLLGIAAAIGAVFVVGLFITDYWRYLNFEVDDPVQKALMLHGALLLLVGLVAGLSVAIVSGSGAGIANGLAAGLIGGAIGAIGYVLVGQLLFNAVNFEWTPAPEGGPRILYCVVPAIAVALLYPLLQQRSTARGAAAAETPRL
jgi:hypothetical protein